MDLGISANVAPLLEEVKQFIDNKVLPVEVERRDHHQPVGGALFFLGE